MPPLPFPPLPVLNYHHVHDGPDPTFRVTPARLHRQLRWLRGEGYRFLTLDALIALQGRPLVEEPSVHITFDDGYVNFMTDAWPVLRELDVPATLFLIGDYLGRWNDWDGLRRERHRHLDGAAVRRLAAGGVAIGAHSATHPVLTSLPGGALRREIGPVRRRLEELIGVPVRAFAYPGGHFDDRVAAVTARHYDVAFTTDVTAGRFPFHPHAVPRIDTSFLGDEAALQQALRPFAPWFAALSDAALSGES